MKRIIALTLVMMLGSIVAFSDIARPEPKPQKTPKVMFNATSDVSITLDPNANKAVLRIPNSTLKYLRAELESENDTDNNAASTAPDRGLTLSRTQTIMSGAFLSLALAFGGFWFIRSGKAASRGVRNLVILGTISAVALTATFVYANIGPPPVSGITNKIFNKSAMLGGAYAHERGMRIERTDGDTIELIVPDSPTTAAPKSVNITPANKE
ncbi:MAG TPA: hypothetical protein PKA82_06855 [Pyrinomonadaceae bacterium]|nr:hypothetical protein [Pyrinomonadaceae bacterium]